MRLFLLLNLRFMAHRRVQTLLCVLGIALGVGVVVAVDLANRGALRSFQRAVDAVAGKATHQIVAQGTADLDERLFPEIWRAPGIRAAAPVVEQTVTVAEAGNESLRIIGTDALLDAPFRAYTPEQGRKENVRGSAPAEEDSGTRFERYMTEPGRIILSRIFAARHGIGPGHRLRVLIGTQQRKITVHGLFEPGELAEGAGNLAVMDIAGAQELFAKVGRLDRIDLVLPADADEQAIAALLPISARIVRAEMRTQRIEQMVRSFQMNLTALSLLAVLVGVFLIYNTLTFAVIQRRSQIGILRCVGATRATIAGLFLLEAALLGFFGSLIGVVLGLGLTRYTVEAVSRTVSQLYTQISTGAVEPGGWTLFQALLLGVGASLAAAILPAIEASRVPPVAAVSRPDLDVRLRHWSGRLALAGALFLVLTGLLVALPTRSVAPGYAGAFTILLGFALASPLVSIVLVRLLSRPASGLGGMVALLGVRNITGSLSRTGPAIAALLVALAMMIGVSLMVRSFRATLSDWIAQTIRADIFIQPAGLAAQREEAFLPAPLLKRLESDPAVESVDVLRRRPVTVLGRPANLNAIRFDVTAPRARDRFLQENSDAVNRLLRTSDAVLISGTLQTFTGLETGDAFELATPTGPRSFRVAGVYRDYSADGGQILMDRAVYRRHWQDDRVNNAALYLRPGADPDTVLARLRTSLAGDYALLMRSNATLRTEILRVFDDTFAITYVMQILSMVVAFCGILSALLALLLERTRELATLRAVGMTAGQVARMLYSEGAALGIIATVLGSAAGTALAALLVFVINVRSFGWTIQFHLFGDIFLAGAAVAIGSALLATIYPVLRLRRLAIAAALREE